MKRMYVIMRDNQDEYERPVIEPIDVVSTMTQAEDICSEKEGTEGDCIYYWREVISSEEE